MAPRRPQFAPSTTAPRTVFESRWQGKHISYDNFDNGVPAMMDPQNDGLLSRPSLLAFRPSRMLRISHQQQHNAVYKKHLLRSLGYGNKDTAGRATVGTASGSDTSDDDWYEGSECGSFNNGPMCNLSTPLQHTRDNGTISTVDEDEEKNGMNKTNRAGRAESAVAVMAMPASGPIPILESTENEDEYNDIDTIICDPSRLPRTLIVDEDGFTLSRETIMARAANVPRGGVIKSGLLFKQGFGLRSGGWKVRFVVLTSSKMTFYKEEHGRKRGEIDLSKCSAKSIEIMPGNSVFDGSQATMWRFAIRGKNRRVLLSAYTENEMKEWLRCLHVALAAQGSGLGRFTDFVVPSGTFLATKSSGLMRSSGVS